MLLKVAGLTKNFGGLAAVNNVDFEVQMGEIVGLIGPNGAGKTTIFNLLSGVFKPTSGTIIFNDQDITNLCPPSKVCLKGIGRTFQVVRPFPNMTVEDNVMVAAFSNITNANQAREYARDVLKFVGFGRNRDTMAKNLTLTDRKCLEVAKALATKPKLLLLDEVMAGLNPTEVSEVVQLIKRIRENGITILIIEHIMAAIMSLSDRIIVLHHGEKISEGAPQLVCRDKKVIDAYLGEDAYLA